MISKREENVEKGEYQRLSTAEGGHQSSDLRGLTSIQHLVWGEKHDHQTLYYKF